MTYVKELNGLKITQEAYEVKRSTLYNWKKKYRDKGIKSASVASIGRIIKELKEKTIPYFWNYPRSPKSNAFIERFNRTLREQFLEQYQYDIKDTNEVNKNLVDYLLWYNTKKPHASIHFDTPFNYAINSFNLSHKKSFMLRDLTLH
jgi:transposase InsO family protein